MKVYNFAKISTRPRPTMKDWDNKWIFGDVKCVINVSTYSPNNMVEAYRKRGIEYHFIPLKEEVEDLGWKNYKLAVTQLLVEIENNTSTIVNCGGGDHRSPLVVEGAYYALKGEQFKDWYKGYKNHLLYDLRKGHFPLSEEDALKEIRALSSKLKINPKGIIEEKAKGLLEQKSITGERAEKIIINLDLFLNQAWYEEQLLDTDVEWSDEWQQIIVTWDNSYSNNEFCVNEKEYSWHTWCGENHHRKDDVKYGFGLGGSDIDESNQENFAYEFYCSMDSGYDYVLNLEKYRKEEHDRNKKKCWWPFGHH